jgi:lipopolysaccharide transport system ATP-binding protein
MTVSSVPRLRVDGIGVDYHVFNHRSRSLWSHFRDGRGGAENAPRRAFDTAALDDLSLSLAAGDRLAVIGANGAGKTTLALVLAGILSPIRGGREAQGTVYPVIAGGTAPHPDATVADLGIYEALRRGRTRRDGLRWAKDAIAFAELPIPIDAPVVGLVAEEAGRLRLALGLQTGSDIFIFDDALSPLATSFLEKLARALNAPERSASIVVACERTEAHVRRICREAVHLKEGRLSDRMALEAIDRGETAP